MLSRLVTKRGSAVLIVGIAGALTVSQSYCIKFFCNPWQWLGLLPNEICFRTDWDNFGVLLGNFGHFLCFTICIRYLLICLTQNVYTCYPSEGWTPIYRYNSSNTLSNRRSDREISSEDSLIPGSNFTEISHSVIFSQEEVILREVSN